MPAATAKLLQTPWLSTLEVAELLGVCRATVHRLVRAGQLPAHRVGLLLRFDAGDVAAYRSSRAGSQTSQLRRT